VEVAAFKPTAAVRLLNDLEDFSLLSGIGKQKLIHCTNVKSLASKQGSATCGPHVTLATFLCCPSHDLGISHCKKGRNVLLLRNTDVNTFNTNNRKNILIKLHFCRCKPITSKSRYCARAHCSVVESV
jgi:hypothetical protein